MSPFPRLVPIAAACVLALGSCCVAAPRASAADLSGYWQGHWSSSSSGHKGPLRCQFTRLDDTSYRADFSGRFLKILPFRISVVLTVTADDGERVQLSGSHYLGRRYGTFHYLAESTCDEFVANFSSCKDHGQFVLSRCGGN